MSEEKQEPVSDEVAFVMNAVMNQVENLSRFSLFQQGRKPGDERRDIDSECGYPDRIDAPVYREYYDRHDIAGRVVDFLPDKCWRVQPDIYEIEDEEETAFEKALADVGKGLMGGSKFESQQGNILFSYMHRIDRESRIGRFGLLLYGLDDGAKLDQPVMPKQGRKLTFLRCFSEEKVTIKETEKDENNPRYGLPTMYEIAFDSSTGSQQDKKLVHWHRVQHIADNRSGSEIYGTPAMEPVFDRLYDIRKILGASGEGCWTGTIQKLFFKRQAGYEDAPALTPDQKEEMRKDIYRFFQSLQRYMNLSGLEAYAIPPAVIDPNPHLEAHIKMICIRIGVPYRSFIGSEEARLASTQDRESTDDQVKHRQETYVTPFVIVGVIDRLTFFGVLPEPEQYYVKWPELSAPSREDKARIAGIIVEALSKYVNGNVAQTIYLGDLLSIVFGGLFTDEEIEQIVENAVAQQEEFDEKEAEAAEAEQQKQLEIAEAQGKGNPAEEKFNASSKQKA
jgi:hypothetical protein